MVPNSLLVYCTCLFVSKSYEIQTIKYMYCLSIMGLLYIMYIHYIHIYLSYMIYHNMYNYIYIHIGKGMYLCIYMYICVYICFRLESITSQLYLARCLMTGNRTIHTKSNTERRVHDERAAFYRG